MTLLAGTNVDSGSSVVLFMQDQFDRVACFELWVRWDVHKKRHEYTCLQLLIGFSDTIDVLQVHRDAFFLWCMHSALQIYMPTFEQFSSFSKTPLHLDSIDLGSSISWLHN